MTSQILEPVAISRPRSSHRYEAYSPKLARRITLFSWDAVQLWTLFEAEAAIDFFCERPGLVMHEKRWQLADFWVQRAGLSEVWFLPDTELVPIGPARRIESSSIVQIKLADLAFLSDQAMLVRNWQAILPYIVSNHRLFNPAQKRRVLDFCTQSQALVDIERAELPADPIVTRSTTFDLVRSGQLLAEDLHVRSLDSSSRFITG